MTLNTRDTEYKRHNGDTEYHDKRYGLGIVDLLPAVSIILVVVLVGVFLSLGATESSLFLERGTSKIALMVISGLLAVAALYFTYRSAQRTAGREQMRMQAFDLLARLDRLEKTESNKNRL